MASSTPASKVMPSLSTRITHTDNPIVYEMSALIKSYPGCMSLGQGIVHWLPPEAAIRRAQEDVSDPVCSGYGIDDGIPELREALTVKVKEENGLMDSSIMVTAGANQAFVNVVLSVCDPSDSVVLFRPYYFNHLMAFQMSGITNVLYGNCDPETLYPDADWVDAALSGSLGSTPKVVVITNPNNPTGTYVPLPLLQRIGAACERAGVWLVLDNTYEYFMYDGRQHACLEGPHVINIFSFSKAYGMMGWRVGYIAYPNSSPGLGAALVKAQDTIPICANIIAQRAALSALQHAGKPWVQSYVDSLATNLRTALDALSPLGPGSVKGGEGAIYLWAKLPGNFLDDRAVVRWLVAKHGVAVIPGSASGVPGFVRVSFANLPDEKYAEAAGRLKVGLQQLVGEGMV